MKKTLINIFLFALLSVNVFAQQPVIYSIKYDGAVNPAASDFIHKSINEAVKQNAECIIIELNTPGGLLKSTRNIVSDILASPIPVIVFVSPAGSQAASAGVFITLAANIAAMAPGTNIGASHPVSMSGGQDSVMNEKSTNDAAAFIRSIAEKRTRNVQWAEDAVRKSVSISENEALSLKVIDIVANDLNDLIAKINGREVNLPSGSRTINTENAVIVYSEMGWFTRLLGVISDPNVAYILMMIGIWGIILEFYNPGGFVAGTFGFVCLVLGLYGLHTLPLNFAGVAFILLAIVLFIAEVKIVSHGMLTVGGVASMLFGSFMLIDTDSGLEFVRISTTVILLTVLTISALLAFVIFFAIRAHSRKITTGEQGLINEHGEVWENFDDSRRGVVKLHGELWNAESDTKLLKGDRIKVLSVNNLTVKVQKI